MCIQVMPYLTQENLQYEVHMPEHQCLWNVYCAQHCEKHCREDDQKKEETGHADTDQVSTHMAYIAIVTKEYITEAPRR